MHRSHLPGLGHCRTAIFTVVALVVAALPLTISAAEFAPEDDDLAECDDVGLSQLRRSTWMKTRKPRGADGGQVSDHNAAASIPQSFPTSPGDANQGHSHHHERNPGVALASDSHGHSHNHGQRHARNHHQHATPSYARRRRRHLAQRTLPLIDQKSSRDSAEAIKEGTEPLPEAAATAAGERRAASSPTAGLTFIQIGSSINGTMQEFADDDDTEEISPPDGPAVGPSHIIANGDGISVAAARAVLRPPEVVQSAEASLGVATADKMTVASISFGVFALVLSLCAVAARLIYHTWQHRQVAQGVRERAEKLRVTHGAELENMFGLCGGGSQVQQPLNPGILMRIQGRVVSESEGSLVAPLSGQSCVMYSASVSHQRHDGIHQPVAFRSESTDFAIELSGSPHIRIAVHSHDVVLFDMADGKRVQECCLSEAPDSWRAFLLSHFIPGQDASSGVALGRSDSLLDFRESALMQGVEVTCIGEVARDRNGRLSLYPRQPSPSPAKGPHSGLIEFVQQDGYRAPRFNTLMEQTRRLLTRGGAPVLAAPRRESLVGRVMISDHPELIG